MCEVSIHPQYHTLSSEFPTSNRHQTNGRLSAPHSQTSRFIGHALSLDGCSYVAQYLIVKTDLSKHQDYWNTFSSECGYPLQMVSLESIADAYLGTGFVAFLQAEPLRESESHEGHPTFLIDSTLRPKCRQLHIFSSLVHCIFGTRCADPLSS